MTPLYSALRRAALFIATSATTNKLALSPVRVCPAYPLLPARLKARRQSAGNIDVLLVEDAPAAMDLIERAMADGSPHVHVWQVANGTPSCPFHAQAASLSPRGHGSSRALVVQPGADEEVGLFTFLREPG